MPYAEAYRRESALPGEVTKATMVGPFELVLEAIDQIDDPGAPSAPTASRAAEMPGCTQALVAESA